MSTADTRGGHTHEGDRLYDRAGHEGAAHHHHGHGSHHHHEHGSHHHGHGSHHHDEPMSQEEAVQSLLVLGQVALDAADYESAVEAYASVLKLEQNEVAAYNLASLYARGLGVRRDYAEAARLFHQSEHLGNEQAGKLCGKCMFDYVREGLEDRSPADVYAAMAVFVTRVYPEANDPHGEVATGLFSIAATLYNRGSYDEAARVFRAAAEFGGDGRAQYYLAVMYNAGTGLRQSDLAALYWLDRAVDSGGVDGARDERDGMIDAYRQSLSTQGFHDMLAELAAWCDEGTPDVPANPAKAARWRAIV